MLSPVAIFGILIWIVLGLILLIRGRRHWALCLFWPFVVLAALLIAPRK
jgi:hypothetical protein